MYSVYIHTFPNGKKYVGVTCCNPESRWGSNGCNYKNPYMVNAIKKYGWDNIIHEIVAENLTADQASQMEIELIQKYNSADKRYGYNISLGGIENKICSAQTKEKLRQANLGKVMSEESRRKISEYQKGKTKSEETIANMSEAQKGILQMEIMLYIHRKPEQRRRKRKRAENCQIILRKKQVKQNIIPLKICRQALFIHQ